MRSDGPLRRVSESLRAEDNEHAPFFCSATINKGIGVENVHYLNDGLWHMKPVK